MKLSTKIESLLFVATKPLALKKIAELCGATVGDARTALEELTTTLNQSERGVHLLIIGDKYQLATHPDAGKLVADYVKSELTGELTRPALETLTIIAYRGPITKAELDIIRGVNCSLILRNLLIRGLIEGEEDKQRQTTVYQVTFDFLRYLGVTSAQELPEYEMLSSHEVLEKVLKQEMQDVAEPQTTTEGEQSAS